MSRSSKPERLPARLQELSLTETQITDAGLVHLQVLTLLQDLSLRDTQVTDAGLIHLKRLNQLENIYLRGTRVTDRGIAELQKALPDCVINIED